jgi:hypothetical protein
MGYNGKISERADKFVKRFGKEPPVIDDHSQVELAAAFHEKWEPDRVKEARKRAQAFK